MEDVSKAAKRCHVTLNQHLLPITKAQFSSSPQISNNATTGRNRAAEIQNNPTVSINYRRPSVVLLPVAQQSSYRYIKTYQVASDRRKKIQML